MNKPMQQRWEKIVSEAGAPEVTPHSLRRTCATRLIRAGVPLPTVQKLLGHSSIQTTLTHYNWVSDDDMRDAVTKMSQVAVG